ncbi:MAG: VanZ family protein [candidate division Zixibacteria bacterium]
MNVDKESKAPIARFAIYHLPVILYGAAIIAVSSVPNLRSPELRLISLDKLAHFLEYALFAFITFRSFSNLKRKLPLDSAYLLTVFFVSLFAVLDEYYQSYVPGRQSDPADLLVDILGAILVASFFWLRLRRARSGVV